MKLNKILILGLLVLASGEIGGTTGFSEEALVEKAKEFTEFYANRLTKDNITEQASQLEQQFHLDQLQIDEETAKMLRALRNPFVPRLPDELPQEEPEVVEKTPETDSPIQSEMQTSAAETPVIVSEQTQVVEEVLLPKPDYKISGIVWNTARPQAIMEGRILDVGDSIEQWRIIGISRGGVEISFKNQKFLIEP
ncbi:MAG TPA: hypothetical protein PLT76_05035 [Candidatus Omnitrophota bacterium]|nr:hypothetical protein [Candidatus Omnitrophota bacterium]HQO58066.1 hypothetical protein [Candidatus Omnitrophota bacterium]HQP12149.1 hypothetical protein [Candidatus Omnitrophota bacterium]